MEAHRSGMRITPYHSLPSTTTIVAKWDGVPVGTVSIIRDSSFGFPTEKIVNVDQYRSKGKRVAEISSLAVDKAHRGDKGALLFAMIAPRACRYEKRGSTPPHRSDSSARV